MKAMSLTLILIGLFCFTYGIYGIINHYTVIDEQEWGLYTVSPPPDWSNEIVLDSASRTMSSVYGKYRLDFIRTVKIVVIDSDTFFREIATNKYYVNDTLAWINPQDDYFTGIN